MAGKKATTTVAGFSYPADMAALVQRELRSRAHRCPAVDTLRELFEVLYFASLKTEEAEPIRCTLTYISSENPDPSPPQRIVADRWTYTRFTEPIPLTVKALVKLAQAVDPAVSSVAVYKRAGGELVIWGLIDQQVQRSAFSEMESPDGPETPGQLQAAIVGIGNIAVYKNYAMLGGLRQGNLVFESHDVLREGPIHKSLVAGANAIIAEARASVGDEIYNMRGHWDTSIREEWVRSLTRVLLGIQRYGHGGAVLIVPDGSTRGLRVKYPLDYARLPRALSQHAISTIQHVHAEDEYFEKFEKAEFMPVGLYLDDSVHGAERRDRTDEVTGCIRFVASLSRVDGLVLLDRSLALKGFGAMITVEDEPDSVWLARDSIARVTMLERIQPSHFGSRHQSMMRFCFQRAGGVGFVISQDGDVRAMTRVSERLVVWENVKLGL